MNPPAPAAGGPGWFGKIPALGDFATRRLPGTFVEPWDAWLSAELSEARFELGDSWPALYAEAPIWCFSLGSGAIDEHAWHGILVPSFDRVGRRFPLTIALGWPRNTYACLDGRWWAALVASGRRALEPGCGADGVDEALALLAEPDAQSREPALVTPEEGTLEDGTSRWWAWSALDPPDAASSTIRGLPRGASFRKLLGAG